MDDESRRQGRIGHPPSHDTDWNAYQQGKNERDWNERLRADQAAAEQRSREDAERRRRESDQRNREMLEKGYERRPGDFPPRRPEPVSPPAEDELTVIQELIALPLVIGLATLAGAYVFEWPYQTAGVAAAVTFALVFVCRLFLVIAFLAYSAALSLGALHLVGVDVGALLDPAVQLVNRVEERLDERVG